MNSQGCHDDAWSYNFRLQKEPIAYTMVSLSSVVNSSSMLDQVLFSSAYGVSQAAIALTFIEI